MDKKELKSVIVSLSPGSAVSLMFLGEYTDRSGAYTLESVRKGRGKGGSLIMTLRGTDGTVFETGTTQSDYILNITGPDGVRHGHESATEVPRKFDTSKELAVGLKSAMTQVVGLNGSRVRVTSTEPEFDGEFEVTDSQKLKGRYGQVRMTLRRDSGETATLWSYRHSGIVTAFDVLTKAARTRTPVATEDSSDEE